MNDKHEEWLKQVDYDIETADIMFKRSPAMDQKNVTRTVRQFRKALESLNIEVEQIILFGSHAMGTAREDSDIDVVVISPSFAKKPIGNALKF